MIDFSRNHFELFGLPQRFRIDPSALDRAYRELQSEVHPDRFANGTDVQKRVALQSSARVNAAYRALKDPVERATYLLQLHGIEALGETDTQLPLAFLERQLERREDAADASATGDARRLTSILTQVESEARDFQDTLALLLDDEQAYARAREQVRQLRFLTKLAEDLRSMHAALEEI